MFDDTVKLSYHHARWYDPRAQVFLSEDPASADENLYRYAGGDPINFVDPSGLALETPLDYLPGLAGGYSSNRVTARNNSFDVGAINRLSTFNTDRQNTLNRVLEDIAPYDQRPSLFREVQREHYEREARIRLGDFRYYVNMSEMQAEDRFNIDMAEQIRGDRMRGLIKNVEVITPGQSIQDTLDRQTKKLADIEWRMRTGNPVQQVFAARDYARHQAWMVGTHMLQNALILNAGPTTEVEYTDGRRLVVLNSGPSTLETTSAFLPAIGRGIGRSAVVSSESSPFAERLARVATRTPEEIIARSERAAMLRRVHADTSGALHRPIDSRAAYQFQGSVAQRYRKQLLQYDVRTYLPHGGPLGEVDNELRPVMLEIATSTKGAPRKFNQLQAYSSSVQNPQQKFVGLFSKHRVPVETASRYQTQFPLVSVIDNSDWSMLDAFVYQGARH